MTTLAHPTRDGHGHALLYAVAAAAFVVLVVVSLFTFSAKRQTAEADRKADQLVLAWQRQGLPLPASNRMVVRVLGTDGGALCTATGKQLTKVFAAYQLSNGAAGPGQRGVLADRRVLDGARSIVAVYCPQRLQAFDDFVAGLKFRSVVRG